MADPLLLFGLHGWLKCQWVMTLASLLPPPPLPPEPGRARLDHLGVSMLLLAWWAAAFKVLLGARRGGEEEMTPEARVDMGFPQSCGTRGGFWTMPLQHRAGVSESASNTWCAALRSPPHRAVAAVGQPFLWLWAHPWPR